MEGIDQETQFTLQSAVNELNTRLGNYEPYWQLARVTKTKWEDIYMVEIAANGGVYFMRGMAFVIAPRAAQIMLDTFSLYGLLNSRIEERLQTYTREHPWIAGV